MGRRMLENVDCLLRCINSVGRVCTRIVITALPSVEGPKERMVRIDLVDKVDININMLSTKDSPQCGPHGEAITKGRQRGCVTSDEMICAKKINKLEYSIQQLRSYSSNLKKKNIFLFHSPYRLIGCKSVPKTTTVPSKTQSRGIPLSLRPATTVRNRHIPVLLLQLTTAVIVTSEFNSFIRRDFLTHVLSQAISSIFITVT